MSHYKAASRVERRILANFNRFALNDPKLRSYFPVYTSPVYTYRLPTQVSCLHRFPGHKHLFIYLFFHFFLIYLLPVYLLPVKYLLIYLLIYFNLMAYGHTPLFCTGGGAAHVVHRAARSAQAAEPRTQCTEPRAAPGLSHTYIRWRFSPRELCRHCASEERNVCYARIMKTYQLGTCGDRILTVKKSAGEHIVTIKVKDSDTKCIELPPKR